MTNKDKTAPAPATVTINKVELLKDIADHLATLATTSAKIRFLDSKQVTRGNIAKILGKRYQHVRNVLITPVKQAK